ncbi:hypothetical protein HMPREF9709_00388 [Helcococcus kunzii ATCC 51366]|uniref:Iron ABC transporter permease n=1 Tax=Helcococcus kunzii ATCC 51366 TaxID=883114 RepID=H3NM27_9FIRM|nr:iron ABC transporter permease [Helcococcus kunzii]EHR35697.1 hypothetical protein HMPREF9709_00388 [Helcococcus kunzii ATCC 51366]QUY64342.1 iron ABC transporter permease [Helcococcus kunzii]
MIKGQKQVITLAFITTVFLFIAIFFSTVVGSVNIGFQEIIDIIFRQKQTENYTILMDIRLPRVAFALVGGVCLALSGLLLQIVLRNPMADSGALGINSGATFVTTLILLVFPVSSNLVPVLSFVGGMGAFLLIILLSWEIELTPTRLILTGAALNAMLRGGQSFLMTMYSDRLQGVITWQNGNLAGKTWDQFRVYCLYIIPVLLIVFLISKSINVLNLSDSTSYSLGVPVRKYRILVSTLGVYLAAITVSQLGMIGFVGLIVPHISKALVGGNTAKTLPFTSLIGALLLLLADLLSRTIASPIEIPIGTVMSILGGPFFLFLISKKSRGMK